MVDSFVRTYGHARVVGEAEHESLKKALCLRRRE
jgi:hypothetical protein